MPNPTKIVVDCSTGIETILELTDAEVAELAAQAAEAEARRVEEAAVAQAVADAKVSAQAKLAALGLTAEEISALSK